MVSHGVNYFLLVYRIIIDKGFPYRYTLSVNEGAKMVKINAILTVYADDDVETEYDIEASWVPYDPGKISGPPENCYPPEGGYAEDVTVKFKGVEIKEIEWAARGIKQDDIDAALEEAVAQDDRDYDGPDRREDD